MKKIYTGSDVIREINLKDLDSKRIAILCHAASYDKEFVHIIDRFHDKYNLKAVFSPQHGLWGHTQANMIEWNGLSIHPFYKVPIYSLYGSHRKPTMEMLEDIDVLVVDLFDIGSRYYTYIWTTALCIEACADAGVKVMILDRPNPIGGEKVEGPVLSPNLLSFVGLFPLPIRHGMTIGEIMLYLNSEFALEADVDVVKMEGYTRDLWFDQTDLTWFIPSPNMPTLDTAIVYPGQCLLEATNISEGRGSTKPFELFGADFIDSKELINLLEKQDIPGAIFRAVRFKPTFDKYVDQIISGAQIHVVSREDFRPFYTTLIILKAIQQLYPDQLEWLEPPYEYEYEKSPLAILLGKNKLYNLMIDKKMTIDDVKAASEFWEKDLQDFISIRHKYLLY